MIFMNAVVVVIVVRTDRDRSTQMGVDLLILQGDGLIHSKGYVSFLLCSGWRAGGIFGTTDACTSITGGN